MQKAREMKAETLEIVGSASLIRQIHSRCKSQPVMEGGIGSDPTNFLIVHERRKFLERFTID